MRFFDDLIKDKVVAINFIFTRCKNVCPLETAQLRQVQKLLGDRVGEDVFLYSITIDPDHDTPEVLKSYAESYQVGPAWTFLTGDEQDIILLRKKLGLYIEEIQSEDSTDHNVNLVIGNQRTGRCSRRGNRTCSSSAPTARLYKSFRTSSGTTTAASIPRRATATTLPPRWAFSSLCSTAPGQLAPSTEARA